MRLHASDGHEESVQSMALSLRDELRHDECVV
jgi:hypothetical protein